MIRVRLFVKMIVLYFCIVVSTLTMLGILLSFLINNYFIYSKQMEMLVKASNISELVQPYIINEKYPGEMISLLNKAEKSLGTEIWIIDSYGNIIAASTKDEVHEGDLIDPADLSDMRQGKTSIRKGQSKIFGETALWVITPVKNENNVIGGTIMFSPIIGITQTTQKVRNLFIYSSIVSILFATVVVHFMAKYVTGPLREMNKIAQRMAKGDFSQRVTIHQADEIGDLGEAFNYMSGQIEKQEKLRRDFVADVSHELRSPLTNIQGFIEAIMDGKDRTPEDRSRYLGIIHKETTRLSRLVNELLYLSKLESGTVETSKTLFSLNEVIESSVQKFLPVAGEKKQNIICSVSEEEIILSGNPDRIEQVITNLLDNACRHSPEGADIDVKLTKTSDSAKVMIIDRGEGIPPEDLPMIWERFYKVDKARKRDTGGTGLGLAIVRQIVESYGGQIEVTSEVGKGTEIGFSLPVTV